MHNPYKKSRTAKDGELGEGRKWWGSSTRKKKIRKQKTYSPHSHNSRWEVASNPLVGRQMTSFGHSKTLRMGHKIEEMENNCAGLIEKVRGLLEEPKRPIDRSSSS